jgi:formylglycine-generating enzyme required for sulfatase activity
MADQVRVFVSHHHSPEEDAFTTQLVADLQGAGATVWVDVADIHEGVFLERINTALASTEWLIVVFTPAALRSQPVSMEVNAAINLVWQRRMRGVIPIVAQACERTEIPPTWAALQRYDAMLDYRTALAGLLQALGLSTASASPAAPPVVVAFPPARTLPPLGPAPAPAGATPAHHLTPMSLYNLGFRGYTVGGVECILPPICPVPSGVFTMGSDKKRDKEAKDDETPQYPVLVGDFAIGQHPVTVAEYACAVRAQAVGEPPEDHAQGMYGVKEKIGWQTQHTHLDHPVVCVSWQDAVAYSCWLAGETQQVWRLPTEAEWEKMARWDTRASHARNYPWGDGFDKARCNTRESRIATTTPVGRYPTGASLYGAQDVAGNVLEWTSSLGRPYPYNENDGREGQQSTEESRIMRGGSWFSDGIYARAAFRIHQADPGSIHSTHAGFRLAWGVVQAGSA